MSDATAVVTAERQAGSARADAEAKSADDRAELRQAVQTTDHALVATRAERVSRSQARVGQLLGAPPDDPGRRATWCGIAYRLETALDDPADAARLAWSKDPLDRLTRGLLEADPVIVDQAKEIVAGATGIAMEPPVNLADVTAWETAVRAGLKAARLSHASRGPDIAPGLGL